MPFVAPLLGLLGGKITRWEIYAVGALLVGLGAWYVVHAHDARLLAQAAQRAQAVADAARLKDAKAATAAVAQVAHDAVARAAALTTARMEIANAPAPAAACGPPAAVLRAVGAMRASP